MFYSCAQSFVVVLIVCIKILQKYKLFRKNMAESAGGLSVPSRESVHKRVNKGKKYEHKRTVSTGLAKKKSKVQKTKQKISHQNTYVK